MGYINLKGLGVALITPFKGDESVDYDALVRIIEFQLEGGIDYLVVLGTTGETSTLTSEEQSEIIRLAVSCVKGRVPIVFGVGGNDTKTVVGKLQQLDFTGVDAILSVVPYYNKPTQEGIYQHYKAVAQATTLPVVLYNVPGRTGVNMTAETTLRLANDFENIVGIKEASGIFSQIDLILKNKPRDFSVISGDDSIAFPLIALGASGIISVVGNAFPLEFSKMVHLALEGDYTNALPIHRRFLEIYELLFVDGNPAGVKAFLHQRGYLENVVRLPLVPVTSATYGKISQAFNRFQNPE